MNPLRIGNSLRCKNLIYLHGENTTRHLVLLGKESRRGADSHRNNNAADTGMRFLGVMILAYDDLLELKQSLHLCVSKGRIDMNAKKKNDAVLQELTKVLMDVRAKMLLIIPWFFFLAM